MVEEAPIKSEDFYMVRFPPKCVEWHFLVNKLIHSVEILAWNDYLVYTHEESGDWVFRLKKERYSASLIAKTFGLSEETVKRLEVIILDPPAANAKLPAPTVEGWGTA